MLEERDRAKPFAYLTQLLLNGALKLPLLVCIYFFFFFYECRISEYFEKCLFHHIE